MIDKVGLPNEPISLGEQMTVRKMSEGITIGAHVRVILILE
jgi:hypothetical protein